MSRCKTKISTLSINVSLALGATLLAAPVFAQAIYGNGNYGDNLNVTGASKGGYQGAVLYKNANNGVPGDLSTGIVVGDNFVGTAVFGLFTGNDVVMTKAGANVNASIVIGNNAQLIAKGISSDGINVGYGSGSMTVVVGDDATITSQYGMGVRANLGDRDSIVNRIEIGKGATITTNTTGSNTTSGEGYAVYAGNRNGPGDGTSEDTIQLGQAIVEIGEDSTITTNGSAAHAVFVNKGGRVVLGDNVTVNTNSTSSTTAADGLHAEKGTTVNLEAGKIELLGGATITVKGAKSNAISATGEGTVVHSYDAGTDTATAGTFNITGNITADQQGKVALNMIQTGSADDATLRSSSVTGNATATNAATIDMTMATAGQYTGNLNASSAGAISLALSEASALTGNTTASGGGVTLQLDSGSQLDGDVTASNQGTVDVSLDASSAEGNVSAQTEGAVTFALSAASQFTGNTSATGLGTVDATLDNASTYIGDASASDQGALNLTLDNGSTMTGNVSAATTGTATVALANGSVLTGVVNSSEYDATGARDDANAGTVNMNMATNSVWNMTDSSVVSNLRLSNARINFATPADTSDAAAFVPTTLTVAGDYEGDGGVMAMNTVLGDDTSKTDKLVVKGSTSGTTNVVINNIGGAGAQTVEGIEIVNVEGDSNGVFQKLDGTRIVAGSYDYSIVNKNKNWYLTSLLNDPGVTPDPDPDPDPEPDPDPDPGITPDPDPDPGVTPDPEPDPIHVNRPESASYIANLAAANTMFMTRLHDRLGETQYTDVLTGEKKVTSMWARAEGGEGNFGDASGQLDTKSHRYVLQVGGDLAQWSSDGLDRWHLGVMGGYGSARSKSQSSITGYSSRGEVDGYSIGLYGTWYANKVDKTGLYVDTWAQYSWFDNKVSGQALESETYKSDGLTASIETGYTFRLGQSNDTTWWLSPKAQVVWMGVSADEHTEYNGTRVRGDGDGNLMTRLGVRAHATATDRRFQPFVEVNWIHNTKDFAVFMNDDKNAMRGARNVGEIKVGVEAQATQRLNLWGNVSYQGGDNGYDSTQAMVGVKYLF
ncbi:autotransporter outer membrane beta-barrel domain-containing protein [Uliginosibacterium sp. sgz301328]|uniref:autotransporter outer membrane beta-barrel domain-containing protein n=1 Tax=Uliginosibacterium sp. sgz301328 TaxID=3243764 RepID=UPI00359CD160